MLSILSISFLLMFHVMSPGIYAQTRDDRQDYNLAGLTQRTRVISKEARRVIENHETRLKALETAPRQTAPRNNGGSRAAAATATVVDVDVREAFLRHLGVPPGLARAAATNTKDRAAAREALIETADKAAQREAATMDVLDRLSKVQAQTSFVLEKGLGKRYSKIARDYGFK